MRTHDLNRNDRQHTTPNPESPATTAGSPGGNEVRQRAQRLLDIADETISQALSQNSERFLSQNRQQGGQ
jgi:hypothetical protein